MGFKNVIKNNRKELNRTIAVLFAFLFFGISSVIVGNSLLDLQIRIDTNFDVISKIMTFQSIGYLVGTITMGFFDKQINHYIAMSTSCAIGGILVIILPLFKSFYPMAICALLKGISGAIIDLVAHLISFNLWKADSAPVLQALRTFFSIGAFVGPLTVRPFMLPLEREIELVDQVNIKNAQFKPEDVQIFWPFLFFGTCLIINALPFVFFYFDDKKNVHKQGDDNEKKKDDAKKIEDSPSITKQYLAVSIVACMFGVSFSVGSLISNYTQAYGVKSSLQMSKQSAALLVSMFWVGAIIARTLSIFLAAYMKPIKVLIGVLILCSISSVLLITKGETNVTYFWLTMMIFGVGRSPIFGLALSTLNKYFIPSGRQTSIMFMTGVISEAFWMCLVGHFMDENPTIFIRCLEFFMIIQLFLVAFLHFACPKIFLKPQKDASHEESEVVGKKNLSDEVFTGVNMESLRRKNSIISISSYK